MRRDSSLLESFGEPLWLVAELRLTPGALASFRTRPWLFYLGIGFLGTTALRYFFGFTWGLSAFAIFVGWPLIGTLITLDDDLPGGWSNSDGTARPDWKTPAYWGRICVGAAIACFVASLESGLTTRGGALLVVGSVAMLAISTVLARDSRRERIARVLFTNDAKAIGGLAQSLTEIESEYDSLLALKKGTVGGGGLWPASRMAVSVDLFLQVGIRRVAELCEALGRDVNAGAFAPVWSGSRGIMEMAALMLDLTGRVQACVAKPTKENFQELDTHLDNISLGFKSIEWAYSEDVMAKNVVTIVERTSKKQPAPFREALERIGAPEKDFMSAYEMVSEGAHPNYVGTLESYQKPDTRTGVCELFDNPAKRDPERIVIPLQFAAGAMLMAVASVRDWTAIRESFIRLLPDYQPAPMPQPRRKPDS